MIEFVRYRIETMVDGPPMAEGERVEITLVGTIGRHGDLTGHRLHVED